MTEEIGRIFLLRLVLIGSRATKPVTNDIIFNSAGDSPPFSFLCLLKNFFPLLFFFLVHFFSTFYFYPSCLLYNF